MSSVLRQSTASQARSLGPFVDTLNGSPETGLTIANTDIKLLKNGGASTNKNSGGATHRANGSYGVTFDATDTDTVGELKVTVLITGALVVQQTFWVLEEAVYDALYAANALGYVAAQVVASVTGNVGGSVGSVVGSVGSVADPTGFRLSSTGVDDILRTALPESYAADGAAGTLTQILYLIQQLMAERTLAGTTLTVKKLDGSTTAATFTTNSAVNPTSYSRTT